MAPNVARGAVRSPVFLVRTTDRAAGIRRGLAALGAPAARGKRVAIKPNFNSADPYPASTHPDTLRLLIEHFRDAGAASITVAERSGMGDTRRVGVALLRLHGGNRTISVGRVFEQDQIARAVELGLGAQGPDQIELVTDDAESRALADRVRGVLSKG